MQYDFFQNKGVRVCTPGASFSYIVLPRAPLIAQVEKAVKSSQSGKDCRRYFALIKHLYLQLIKIISYEMREV